IGGTVRVDTDLLDRFINLTGELVTNRYMLQTALGAQDWRELQEGLGQLGKLVKNLHGQVLKVRMMPVGSITERLPRVVRDLCRKNNKEITLKIEGAEIELDRSILEEVADPLMHMVRNSIDHGIEQRGTVLVKVWRERSQVQVQIQDNGRGIDPRKIREQALEKGLISPKQAQNMRDTDALQLICMPGFSTKEQVTETSGRGVGMDVVKAAVEKLGGTLLIASKVGQGSRITMQLPLSVAIIRILLLECDGKLMALPISRIIQTHQVERHEVQSSGKQLVVQLKDEKLPLLSLRKILKMPVPPASSQISIVVMELFGRKVGLVVDQLVGHQEVFVKKLPAPFDRLRGTNGGAILGDGKIVFILDVQSFLERRR
ncbi:MAG TPA: chemotaxis protein CheA, partial [Geopsychrobacteraceae bacterium]|nr:chemotaxis protein CheA [Geopsychrobacteraceae bacterium]